MRRPLAVVSAALVVGCGGPTTVVTSDALVERIVAPAIVVPAQGVARVRAPFTGHVVSVSVVAAARVRRGDTLAEIDADDRLIPEPLVAPIDGAVLVVRASPGDDVSPADEPMFELADPEHIELRVELADDAATRTEGATVRVTSPGGGATLASGPFTRLTPRMEPPQLAGPGRGATPVRGGFVALEPSDALPIGRELEAIVELPATEVRASVPRSAVLVRDGRAVVLSPGLLFDTEIEVALGRSDGERIEVDGIAPGAVVRADPR